MSAPHIRIERTRNRSSRAVLQDNTIVIRLGRYLSRFEEERHIEFLLRRMEKVWKREQGKCVLRPLKSVLQEQGVHRIEYADGTYETIVRQDGKRTMAQWKDDVLLFSWHKGTPRATAHRLLWRMIAAQKTDALTELVHRINADTFRFPLFRVRLRFAKTQWGSCSARGSVTLNPALLFVPPHLLRYVIIHELAHLRHHNHGARFWSTVESACPDFRDCIKAMRGYRIGPL